MGKKVFISHSSIDKELVKIITDFLNNVGIANDDIFCTSISGALEGGKNFVNQIQDNIKDSKVVIFLLSERFFLSNFCLAELGAAWALNQKILPVIVPPISIAEYNSTPLVGIHALIMGSANFTNELFDNLLRMNVVGSDCVVGKAKLFGDFNSKFKTETTILRADSYGFYVTRLIGREVRQVQYRKQMPCHALVIATTTCNYISTENQFLYRLNNLLDLEEDLSITEHWILIKSVQLSSEKLKFQLGELLEQNGTKKLFSVKNFLELP